MFHRAVCAPARGPITRKPMVAVVAAFTLVAGLSWVCVPPAAATPPPTVSAATVSQALNLYARQLTGAYDRAVSPNTRTILAGSSLKPMALDAATSLKQAQFAEAQAGWMRDTYASSGLAIRGTTVLITPLSYAMSGANIVATVDMTSRVSSIGAVDGTAVSSSWSDQHVITLAPTVGPGGVSYQAISDKYVAPPSEGVSGGPAAATGGMKPSSASLPTVSVPAPATSGGFTTYGGAQPYKINVQQFVAYADKWTAYPNENKMNPAYPIYSNNCTNFGSQVLDNAGFILIGGNSLQVWDTNVWTFNLAGIAGASRTWTAANYSYSYVYYKSGQYGWLDNIWNARPGDVLYVDWDPNGRADGTIDHMMVVTGMMTVTGSNSPTGGSFYSPLISQKTNNRHNIPLQQSINLAKANGVTSMVWYGLKHKA